MTSWRERLYGQYVSSGIGGQASVSGFMSRKAYLSALVKNHMPLDRNAAIIDLGCGSGDVIYWLKQAGYRNVTGYDRSQEMVDLARRFGIEEVKLGDLFKSLRGLPDRSVDAIIAFDVFEHLTREDLFSVCDEILRALRPGGKIILHTPNAAGIFGAKVRYSDLTHELAFTESSMTQLLSTTGFSDIRCYEDKPISHGLKSIARAFIWHVGSGAFRLLHAAETGDFHCILSQNFLSVAVKAQEQS